LVCSSFAFAEGDDCLKLEGTFKSRELGMVQTYTHDGCKSITASDKKCESPALLDGEEHPTTGACSSNNEYYRASSHDSKRLEMTVVIYTDSSKAKKLSTQAGAFTLNDAGNLDAKIVIINEATGEKVEYTDVWEKVKPDAP
jgi:hypothetical protein